MPPQSRPSNAPPRLPPPPATPCSKGGCTLGLAPKAPVMPTHNRPPNAPPRLLAPPPATPCSKGGCTLGAAPKAQNLPRESRPPKSPPRPFPGQIIDRKPQGPPMMNEARSPKNAPSNPFTGPSGPPNPFADQSGFDKMPSFAPPPVQAKKPQQQSPRPSRPRPDS